MKRIGISLAIIAAIAIGPVAITSAGANTSGTDASPNGAVIVDNVLNDSTQDPACDISAYDNVTTFSTIQGAVNYEEAQAVPATIYVCAGTYNESPVIDENNIVLDGAQWETDGYDQANSSPPVTVVNGSIIYLELGTVIPQPNSYSSSLTGEQVNGFTLQGAGPIFPQIWAVNAGSGYTFTDNIIDVSNGGIVLNTQGIASPDGTSIADNQFNQSTAYVPAAGPYTGEAVAFYAGTANNVQIYENYFNDLSGANGDINTTGTGKCTGATNDTANLSTGLGVDYNGYEQNPDLTGYGNSLVNLVCTSGAEIYENNISLDDYTNTAAVSPIYLGGGDVNQPLISENDEYGYGGGAKYASGIEFTSAAYNNDDPSIIGNFVTGFGEGVYGYGGSSVNAAPSDFEISGNDFYDGVVGIDISGALQGSPNGGLITGNDLADNVYLDCADSTGPGHSGTVGTQNTWTVNSARSFTPSNPVGLCLTNVVTPGPNPTTAYVGGTGFTPYASATSGDTTVTSDPTDLPNVPIQVSLDPSSTGCYLSAGVIGYNGSGTCVIDYEDPGYNQWGFAYASQSFSVGSGVGGGSGSGSGAAPASSTSVTLTFNSEGGTSEPSQTVTSGTSVTLPTPTLTGDTFLGWFTSATGGTLVTSPYDVTASTTLYAQWETNASTPAAAAFRYAFTIHTFVFGSSALTAQIKDQINHLVVLFNAHDVVHINLRGNATLPNNSYNQALARARAAAVEAYMRSLGIHASITTTATVSGATYNFAYLVVYVTTP